MGATRAAPLAMARRGLALFDFDGTITTRDSMAGFLMRTQPLRRLLSATKLLPGLLRYGRGKGSATVVIESVVTHFLAGVPTSAFADQGAAWARDHLPGILRPEALDRLAWHRACDDHIVVVTSSFAAHIAPWCASGGYDLVATRLESADGALTGRVEGLACDGAEKVNRVRAAYDLAAYSEVYAYGNSKWDRPLLALADRAFYRFCEQPPTPAPAPRSTADP